MTLARRINSALRPIGIQIVRAPTLDCLVASQAPPPSTAISGSTTAAAEAEAFDRAIPPGWEDPLAVLRRKWGEVPAGDQRLSSARLLTLSDEALLAEWQRARDNDTLGSGFGVRGWYHETYRTLLPRKRVLDIGCGMALSTLTFAEMGARLTFVDIVADNVALVRRLCQLKGIAAEFLVIERFEDLDRLGEHDIVAAIGSLINAPLAVTKLEVDRLKRLLRPGGRWLHLGYPKSRWQQEGCIPFAAWGEHTDGPGTPWMEYHDRAKMEWLFAPSDIRILFECEWHDHAYNWFDIELVRH